MNKTLKTAALAGLVGALTALALAKPLMTKDQYIEYSAKQHCINQDYWDQPDKQNAELSALDKAMGIGEGDYAALDDLAMEYDMDPSVQEAVETKARKMCPPQL